MSGRKEKEKRRQARDERGLTHTASSAGQLHVQPGAQPGQLMVKWDVQVSKLRAPDHSFSADVVWLKSGRHDRVASLYFAEMAAASSTPRAAVRVKIPESSLKQQLARDSRFRKTLSMHVAKLGLNIDALKLPSFDTYIDALPTERYTSMDAAFMSLAFNQEAAVCDLFNVPANFALVASQRGKAPAIDSVLRIFLPTLALHYMFVQMEEQLLASGEPT